MKFKDLEEGKPYTSEGNTYEKREGLLWFVQENCWSGCSARKVSNMDFKEVPQYVTLQEAIEHMRVFNNLAECDGLKYRFNNNSNILETCNLGQWREVKATYVFFDDLLKSKWVLL